MFSGIIEDKASIARINVSDSGGELTLRSSLPLEDSREGDSFSINGVCLTLISRSGGDISFELAPETLRRSTLGELKVGMSVNLERSLRVGDRLHGHFVFGHVDGVGHIASCINEGNSIKLQVSFPGELREYIVPKGSISISGVSLTIGDVEDKYFTVYIIPHTAEVTTLGSLNIGDRVNLEIDMLARYARARVKE